MKSIIAASILLLSSTHGHAAEPPVYMPFPEAQISLAQWETYRQQVHEAYSASLRRFPNEHLEVLHSTDTVMHFAFTTAGHPAHPAWITRSAQDGTVNQIGYFAGKEEPFAKLFQSYLELTERTIDSVPDESPESSSPVGTEPGA
ncbi:hypothetical protein [Pseudoxanthomonas sp. PXM01]|uniref:hypothetical protein n=1 Tax=Pseudoxanthomonas sp. PXM01 TaxID=2769295 RepID=UPI00177D3311|nr:hypothetical protein [Pseudoxanthomonas sp. PXM01]MBD9469212.1 hypothetical protein [Pseudoxanthomonas sp. PXM01]